jgi:hypothetical protein
MEVDHFNPTLTGKARHQYRNLMWAARLCNNARRDYWPSSAERKRGIRFLNPCAERDYGECIFEDPLTHELIGKTGRSISHQNASTQSRKLCLGTRNKAQLAKYSSGEKLLQGSWGEIQNQLKEFRETLKILIPPIAYELVLQAES